MRMHEERITRTVCKGRELKKRNRGGPRQDEVRKTPEIRRRKLVDVGKVAQDEIFTRLSRPASIVLVINSGLLGRRPLSVGNKLRAIGPWST